MITPVAQTTKAIRAELKAAFPGHKFSVTCKNFSMGSSFRVTWLDGVTKEQVEEITGKYKDVSRCELSGEILGGGNTYASIDRSYSPAVMQPELDRIVQKYVVRNGSGEEVSEMATSITRDGSMDLAGFYSLGDNRCNTVRSLLAETLGKISYYQAPEGKKAVTKSNPVSRSIEDNETILEYLFPEDATATDCGATVTENLEKDGVEVKFDRKPDSATLDALKGNGFRYSRNLNIWYAKRTAKTLRVAHSLSSISVDSTPVTESTPTDFSYLLGAESEQPAQDVAAIEAEEIEPKISAPRRTVLALMPAVEIEEDKTISPVLAAIEPEVIEDPDLSVSEFEQAANSGKVISLLAFATAIRREQTPVPVKPSYQVIDTFSIEPVAIEQSKPTFEVIRTLTASGLTAW
ncbi:LPD29 domain-containing protein [Chamaesiphon sp.]|uniref:LPD29 domain-containing protein n=1 Tax=Chamaesiphon sp. TaxID=2814140 RepID=UPI003593F7C4